METNQNSQRKLAAIMFTDIVDYSDMMNKDEKTALNLLDKHNKLVREQFDEFNGIEIKNTGDGFLVKYDSSLDSVNSAISIQKALELHNSTREVNKQINLRIGIHLGDIEEKDGDIYGDGVNIASRIEPYSESGGICISRQIYDQVNNKIKFEIENTGEKKLKNIAKPVELYNITLPWNDKSFRNVGDRKVANSIAVMPFVNMSSDKENEFLCDGLTEELLNVLAHNEDLKVISRTSVFSYKGKKITGRQIGAELGVENMLEGSIRKAGDKVRITAQLIRTADDFHLWSDTYTRSLNDVACTFDLEDEIASKILSQMHDKLIHVDCSECSSKSKSTNTEASKFYQEGLKFWNSRNKKGLNKAVKLFDKAIECDPNFSSAYVMKADSYLLNWDDAVDRKRAMEKAKNALDKAEKLNDTSAEFYTVYGGYLGQMAHYSDKNKEDAKKERLEYYNIAIEKNPNYATAHHRLAMHNMGDNPVLAIKSIEKAVSLDPKSVIIQLAAALLHHAVNQNNRSLKYSFNARKIDPAWNPDEVSAFIFYSYMNLWEWEKCKEHIVPLEKVLTEGGSRYYHSCIEYYMAINDNKKAQKLIKAYIKQMDEGGATDANDIWRNMFLGQCYIWLDDFKNALKTCQKTQGLADVQGYKGTGRFAFFSRKVEILTKLKKYDEALGALVETEKYIESETISESDKKEFTIFILCQRGIIYIRKKDLENAYLTIHTIKNLQYDQLDDQQVQSLVLALLYNELDNIDESLKYFTSIKKENIACMYVNNLLLATVYESECKNLRKDPRYIDILKYLNLYSYWKDDPSIKKLQR